MAWTCAEERRWIYWGNDAEDGAAGQKNNTTVREKFRECSEGRHAGGGHDRTMQRTEERELAERCSPS